MKRVAAFLFLLATAAACRNGRPVHPADSHTATTPVIDVPSVVILGDASAHSPGKVPEIERIRKSAQSRSMSVVDTCTAPVRFRMKSGKVITLDPDPLLQHFDLIFFDRESDPEPCTFAEARKLLSPAAAAGRRAAIIVRKLQKVADEPVNFKEIPKIADTLAMTAVAAKQRKVIVQAADTSGLARLLGAKPRPDLVFQQINTRKQWKLTFENDLITFNNTDRYYTNGLRFAMQTPRPADWRISRIFLPYRRPAFVTYAIGIRQEMYTPTDTRIAPSLSHDRPYASLLSACISRSMYDAARKLDFITELDLGFIGPGSAGSYLQAMVHRTFPTNDQPVGWETQLGNDLVLNYNVKWQKYLFDSRRLALSASAGARAGTLYNDAGPGLQFRYTLFDPNGNQAAGQQKSGFGCYFHADAYSTAVAYNALLQGGFFNRNNVFTLPAAQISRVTGSGKAVILLKYRGLGVEMTQHFLSPEYKGGYWHKWGSFSLLFDMNR